LPLAQILCTQLYEMIDKRPAGTRVIDAADVASIGGVEGGIRQHVDQLVAQTTPTSADRNAFRKPLTGLYLRQPDGSLSTALDPADELAQRWEGRTPFEEMLAKASSPECRLLRVASLRLGGGGERRYVSLGHDALAQVAQEWDEELSRRARV